MSTVISIEDVSKLYRLGEIGTGSLAHDVNRWWHKIRGNEDPYLQIGVANDRSTKGDSDYVYAVKDVSFEVKEGEVLGIIGRNGAGKSTLLKILSRVTTPTSGKIKVKGRIASLLEVGTGFHPELTGRDNIFLNGAILGMRKGEIRSKFDEIVDFSGCERYIDTPVKRYSSGMYVRLAFAVAAHLEPEILIVDEVLAVGDAEFQTKCLGKMKDVAKGGRTVIYVSHQLATLRQICNSGVLMKNGMCVAAGPIEAIIDSYLSKGLSFRNEISFPSNASRPSITRIEVDSDEAKIGNLSVFIDYTSPSIIDQVVPGILLRSESGDPVYGSNRRIHPTTELANGSSAGRIHFRAEGIPIQPGRYVISCWLGEWHVDHDNKLDILTFDFREGQRHPQAPTPSNLGYLDVVGKWQLE